MTQDSVEEELLLLIKCKGRCTEPLTILFYSTFLFLELTTSHLRTIKSVSGLLKWKFNSLATVTFLIKTNTNVRFINHQPRKSVQTTLIQKGHATHQICKLPHLRTNKHKKKERFRLWKTNNLHKIICFSNFVYSN